MSTQSRTLIYGSILGFAACNSVTGASSLQIVDAIEDAKTVAQSSGETTGNSATGAGGATAASTSDVTTASAGGATSLASTSTSTTTGVGGAPTTAVVSVSSSSGGPTMCVYPPGPYGTAKGDTLDPKHTWQGYKEGSDEITTVSMADFLDCDGTRGINALLIDSSALWCPACQDEAQHLPADAKKWGPLGIHVVTLIIEDNSHKPATTANAETWRTTYSLDTSADIVADPNFSMQPSGESSVGLPVNTVVDPRTMKVVDIVEGFSPNMPSLTGLAQKNGG